MRRSIGRFLPLLLALFAASSLSWLPAEARPGKPQPAPAAPNAIACRVLEAHASTALGVTAVVFHQRAKEDSSRLGSFLSAHSEAAVEFQSADGSWHPATVARIKTCFGRGLLLFSSAQAQLKEKDSFLLRLPAAGVAQK